MPLPPSAAERAIWLGHRLDPTRPAYTMALAVTWHGPVDGDRLERAFHQVVAESDALRSVYRPTGDGTDCAVHVRDHGVSLQRVEAATLGDVDAWMEDRARRAFDVTDAVAEAWWIRHGPEEHTLLTVKHHLVTDGGSFAAFQQRLIDLYTDPDAAPPLPAYRDWAAQPPDPRIPAVRDQLLDRIDGLDKPVVWDGRTHTGGPVSRHVHPLTPRLDAAVATGPYRSWSADLARQALLATATAVLTARLTGAETVVLGTPHPMRWTPDAKRMVGVCTENLPLVLPLRDATMHDVFQLATTRSMELLRGGRPGLATSELQRAITADLNFIPRGLPELPGTTQRVRWLHAGWSEPRRVPLRIQVHDFDGTGRRALFDLAHDVFPDADALIRQFDAVLDEVIDTPDAPALRPVDWTHARATSGLDARRRAPDQLLHERVFDWAERTPTAPAIVHGDRTMDHATLRDRALAVASSLHAQGVRRGDRVALCHPRTPELLTGLLGILAAGAAYVPLEPHYPAERIATVLDDCAVAAVVAPADLGIPGDVPRVDPAAASGSPSPVDLTPDDRAYLLYTSGSTGRPKAVEITHRNVAGLLAWRETLFSRPFDAMLAATSICFDVSVFELFTPLTTGGTVHLADDLLDAASGPAAQHVRALCAVPSAIRALLATHARPFPKAHTVVLAGEYADPALVDALYDAGVEDVFDIYGPTEATVYALGGRRDRGAPPTIGRPLPGTLAFLLDDRMRPVAPGQVGELYLGGEGLARGYWNRPTLTAERFVDAPPDSGTDRLYRTGDLGCFTAAGEVVYHGRSDDQVKIRGFRIEPGEVAACARACAQVEDVWVGAVDTPHGRSLAAAVVGCSAATLVSHLADRLPAHLVPTRVLTLDRLPLNVSGKLDVPAIRARFTTPVDGDVPEEASLVGLLQRLVGESLGRQVSADTGFLDAGGDSILALYVSAAAQKRGLDLAPVDLLNSASLRAAASSLRTIASDDHAAFVGSFTPPPIWRHAAGASRFDQSIVVTLPTASQEQLQRALDDLLAHHDALRIRPGDPPSIPAGTERWPLSWHDGPATPAALQRAREVSWPPDGPRVHATAFPTGELVLVAHHAAVDAVTWNVLVDDLVGRLDGHPLPPRTTSYPAWCEALRALPSTADFWRGVLPDDARLLSPSEQDLVVGAMEAHRSTHRLPTAYQGAVRDLLLAALATVLTDEVGGTVLVDVEGHGRIDAGPAVLRTAGWFTAMYPVPLTPDLSPDAVARWFDDLPLQGAGHGLAVARGELAPSRADVLFQYFGAAIDPRITGPLQLHRADDHPVRHVLDIVATRAGQDLQVTWHHAPSVAATRLAARFDAALARAAGPRDFGLETTTLDTLAGLLAGR